MQRPELSLANENLNGLPPDDPDLERDRQENDSLLKSAWETIFDKYGRDFADVGDEIDLETGEIVVDNGHIHQMRDDTDVGGNDVSQMMRYFTKRAEEEQEEEDTESASSGYDEEVTSSQDGSISFENEHQLEPPQELTPPITSGTNGRRDSRVEAGSCSLVLASEEDDDDVAPMLVQGPPRIPDTQNTPQLHGLHHSQAPHGSLQSAGPPPPQEAYAAALQDFSQSIANQITTFMSQWMGVMQSNNGVPQAPNFAASLGQALSAPSIQPPAPTIQAPQNVWAYPALPEDSQAKAPSKKKKRGYKETVERSPKRKSLWAQDSSGDVSESTDDEPPPVRRKTNHHSSMRYSNREADSHHRPRKQPRHSDAVSHRPVDDLAEASDQPDDEIEEYEEEIEQMDFSNMVSRLYVRPVWQRFKRRDGKLIRILIEKFGKGWGAIMPYFPGRKEAHVQYFYYKYLHETKGVTKRPYTQAVTGKAAMMRYAREGIVPPTRSLAHRKPLPRRGNPSLEELRALAARLDKNPMTYTDEELEKYRGPYPPKSASRYVNQYNAFRLPRINAAGFGAPYKNTSRCNSGILSSPVVDPSLLEPNLPSSTGLGRHKFRTAPSSNPDDPPTIELWSSKPRKTNARPTYGGSSTQFERSSEANSVYGGTPSKRQPAPATPRNSGPRVPTNHRIFQASSTRKTPILSFAYNPGREETHDDHDDLSDSPPPIMLWGQKKTQSTPAKSPAATTTNPLPTPVEAGKSNTRNRSERPTTPSCSDKASREPHQEDEVSDVDDGSRPASVRHSRTPRQGCVLTTANKSQEAESNRSRLAKSNHSRKATGSPASTLVHRSSSQISRNDHRPRHISSLDGTDEAPAPPVGDTGAADSPNPRKPRGRKELPEDAGDDQEREGDVSTSPASESDTRLISNGNAIESPAKNPEADNSTMPSSPPSPLLANQTAYLANKLATAAQKGVPGTPTSKLRERPSSAKGSTRRSASTITPRSTRTKPVAQNTEKQVAEGESEDELALW